MPFPWHMHPTIQCSVSIISTLSFYLSVFLMPYTAETEHKPLKKLKLLTASCCEPCMWIHVCVLTPSNPSIISSWICLHRCNSFSPTPSAAIHLLLCIYSPFCPRAIQYLCLLLRIVINICYSSDIQATKILF